MNGNLVSNDTGVQDLCEPCFQICLRNYLIIIQMYLTYLYQIPLEDQDWLQEALQ